MPSRLHRDPIVQNDEVVMTDYQYAMYLLGHFAVGWFVADIFKFIHSRM